ncbi:MAG: hypothetical protein ABEH35_00625 [Haloarculaceae archaeon]
MGVRPPSNDTDEPAVVEFGIAALEAQLRDAEISYPVDADDLRDEIGHIEVPFDASGHTVRLSEALEEVDHRQFESERDLLNALHPVFERKREAATTSLLSQLRALVPF